jgi:hypothetical protein
MARNAGHAECGDGEKPGEHDGTEEPADALGALPLDDEKAEQDRDRERQDDGLERRRDDLQPLDRGQHRDRGRDRAVAIDECRAE